jgi:hypothetical protein
MTHQTADKPPLASPSRSISRLSARLALLVAGLLVPLVILELGVRLTGLAPSPEPNPVIWQPHPLFGWWHIPHSGGIFRSDFNEFEAEVRINARGLRDQEIGYDNPDDALRVLSLADSFGEALQVNLADTYHKQLQSRLAASLDRPVQVLNVGVGGWGTDQEAIFYLAEGFRYEPELVLLAFFVRNDVVNNYSSLELARNGGSQQKEFFSLAPTGQLIPPSLKEGRVTDVEANEVTGQLPDRAWVSAAGDAVTVGEGGPDRPAFLGLADVLWRASALYRFSVPYLRDIPAVVQNLGPSGILGGEAIIRANHPTTPIPFFVYQDPPDEQFEAAWGLTEAIIARLRDEVTRRGSQLAVVIIAAPEQVYPEEWQRTVSLNPGLQTVTWDLEGPNRRLGAFLATEEIPYLDLLPLFRQAAVEPGAPPLHFSHDQHWTVAGHRLAAQAIHDFLIDEVLSGRD